MSIVKFFEYRYLTRAYISLIYNFWRIDYWRYRNIHLSIRYVCSYQWFRNLHEFVLIWSQETLAEAYTHFDYFTRLYTRSLPVLFGRYPLWISLGPDAAIIDRTWLDTDFTEQFGNSTRKQSEISKPRKFSACFSRIIWFGAIPCLRLN